MPAAQACGRAAVGYAIGNGDSLRERPAKTSGSWKLNVPAASSMRAHDAVRVGPARVPREAPRDERVVVGPDRSIVVAERAVRRLGARHRPHAPARPQVVAHQRIDHGVDARRRHDAAPEQVADVRAERVDAILLGVERERVVAAALLDPVRLVEPRAQLVGLALEPVRRAPGRARPRGRARPCAASRRRRSPAPHTARSAPARTGRRGSAASRPSPSTTGCRARARCAARTRRSRRRPGRRIRRSTGAPPARARAARARGRHRPSSAMPRRAGRGRAASRRRCRSSGRTTSCAHFPRRTSCTILPGSASRDGSSSVAWSFASSRSADCASSGPKSIVCRQVMTVSRPNTVMNHGIPAAGSLPWPASSAVRMRSAARSFTDCPNVCPSSFHEARICGTRSCHAPTDSATRARSSPKWCSTASGARSASPLTPRPTSTRIDQVSRGASVRS